MRWQVGCVSLASTYLDRPAAQYSLEQPQLQLCIIHMDVDNICLVQPPLAPPATTTKVTPSEIAETLAHTAFREGPRYAHTSPMAVLDPCLPTLHVCM